MSDHYQVLAGMEPGLAKARRATENIVRLLVGLEAIEPEPVPDLALGEPGYPPGPRAEEVLGTLRIVGAPRPSGFRPHACVEVIVRRQLYDLGDGGARTFCPGCGEEDHGAVSWCEEQPCDEWAKQTGPGLMTCRGCGVRSPITDWRFDPPQVFGNFGIKFWNWPPLTPAFVERIARESGHDVTLVRGVL